VATRFRRCTDFDAKRQFLVDYVEKIIFHRDKVTLIGCVPIELKQAESITGSSLPFHIEGQIDRAMVRRLPKGQNKFNPNGQLVKSTEYPPARAQATMPPLSTGVYS
jgi:hypothetical protein